MWSNSSDIIYSKGLGEDFTRRGDPTNQPHLGLLRDGRRALDRAVHARVGPLVAGLLPAPRPPRAARGPAVRQRRRPTGAQRGVHGGDRRRLRLGHPGRVAGALRHPAGAVGGRARPDGGAGRPPGGGERLPGRRRAPERSDPHPRPGAGAVRRRAAHDRLGPRGGRAHTEEVLIEAAQGTPGRRSSPGRTAAPSPDRPGPEGGCPSAPAVGCRCSPGAGRRARHRRRPTGRHRGSDSTAPQRPTSDNTNQ